jgi:hypothetical protein
MAFPLVPIALAISAVAAGAGQLQQSRARSKSQQQQAELLRREQQRQAILRQQSEEAARRSLDQFTPEEFGKTQESELARDLETINTLVTSQDQPTTFTQSSAPKVIKGEFDKQLKKGQDEARSFAENLAKFGAGRRAMQQANIQSFRNALDVGRASRDATISASLLEPELATAGSNAASPLGEALSTIGQQGMSTALSGGFGSFGGGGEVTPSYQNLQGQSPLRTENMTQPISFIEQSKLKSSKSPIFGGVAMNQFQ